MDRQKDGQTVFLPILQGLPELSEGLLEGPRGLPEGPEGLLEGSEGLPERPEGLPEGPEGLPGQSQPHTLQPPHSATPTLCNPHTPQPPHTIQTFTIFFRRATAPFTGILYLTCINIFDITYFPPLPMCNPFTYVQPL